MFPEVTRDTYWPIVVKCVVAGTPQVYKYNVATVPDCAVTNKHFYNISFCLEDPDYPV